MPRPEKVQAVAEIKDQFESAQAVFLTEYRGIPVKEMGNLRRRLRESGAEYKVVKMSLARRAVDDLGLEGLDQQLVGPTALAFAHADPVTTAKALRDYARENENLVIKLGFLADAVLTPEDVVKLADIEPREVLLARIAGAAKAPLFGLAAMLGSFTREAASLFSALADKKEASGGTTGPAVGTEETPASPDSPASPASPESPDSPDSPESPDSADSPDEASAPADDNEEDAADTSEDVEVEEE